MAVVTLDAVHRADSRFRVDRVPDEPSWFAAPAARLGHFPRWTAAKQEATVVRRDVRVLADAPHRARWQDP
jgi:hypothetical protein